MLLVYGLQSSGYQIILPVSEKENKDPAYPDCNVVPSYGILEKTPVSR